MESAAGSRQATVELPTEPMEAEARRLSSALPEAPSARAVVVVQAEVAAPMKPGVPAQTKPPVPATR